MDLTCVIVVISQTFLELCLIHRREQLNLLRMPFLPPRLLLEELQDISYDQLQNVRISLLEQLT